MQPQELWVTVLLQYRALSLMHTSACFCTLLFSLPMISNTSLYYIIGHESLNKTSRRKSSMRWSFDALFCSPGRVVCVCVCMRDSVCQPTLSGCVGVARIDLLQIAGGSSLIAAPDAGLCFRGRHPREDTAVSRLIKPTLIPIITCTKLSSDSQCNSLVLCRQSPFQKGDTV